MTDQIVHEVTCAWPPCNERVGTSESFNALAFLLSDLGWANVQEAGLEVWFCPLHLPVEKDPFTKYLAYCINCNFDWDEEFTEDEFPRIRAEHSRSCFNDSHPQCSPSDVKFRPNVTVKPTVEQVKSWEQAQLESDAYDRYVEYLITQDQWRRSEDEVMSQRSWLVRTILKIRNSLK